jgi:sugar/nucleoside kinase (ribokinase family)
VLFIAAVGDDALGRQALDGFSRENLITRQIRVVPGEPSGVALILVDEQGENCISVASGANSHLRPADVDARRGRSRSCATLFGRVLMLRGYPLESSEAGLAGGRPW